MFYRQKLNLSNLDLREMPALVRAGCFSAALQRITWKIKSQVSFENKGFKSLIFPIWTRIVKQHPSGVCKPLESQSSFWSGKRKTVVYLGVVVLWTYVPLICQWLMKFLISTFCFTLLPGWIGHLPGHFSSEDPWCESLIAHLPGWCIKVNLFLSDLCAALSMHLGRIMYSVLL